MKKFLLFFLLLLMIISLIGCTQTPITNPGNLPVFNESPVNCTQYIQGNIYYNNVTLKVQVCDGTGWSNI